jgi:molybdopterin-containing oxidoreductase family iron-sulfur binding subunit
MPNDHSKKDPSAIAEHEPSGRREFLKAAALIAGGATLGAVARMAVADTPKPSAPKDGSDALARMQKEIEQALARPVDKRRWAMAIDIRKCIGCNACTVACIAENNLPPRVTYRTVFDETDGDYPNLRRFFMPTNCYQCANPPCVKAANQVIPGSMSIRPDGIVAIDYAKMKGKPVFDAATKACPYGHALYYDEGGNYTDGTPAVQPYEQREATEYGQKLHRADTVGVTRKCHFCIQRIEAGGLPACVATCTGQAMHFGDQADPGSLVSELIAQQKQTFVMNQDAGTGPRVIYLHDEPANAEMSCAKCHDGGNLK